MWSGSLIRERSVEEETIIIKSKQEMPCKSCKHNGRRVECNNLHCFGDKLKFPGYEPYNQTYDYQKFYDKDAEAYAKLIVRERIITRHRFPMDNFNHDTIREDAYKDIKLEDLV